MLLIVRQITPNESINTRNSECKAKAETKVRRSWLGSSLITSPLQSRNHHGFHGMPKLILLPQNSLNKHARFTRSVEVGGFTGHACSWPQRAKLPSILRDDRKRLKFFDALFLVLFIFQVYSFSCAHSAIYCTFFSVRAFVSAIKNWIQQIVAARYPFSQHSPFLRILIGYQVHSFWDLKHLARNLVRGRRDKG